MKRIILTLSLVIFAVSGLTYAQLAKDSWSLGFGFSYPRFQSSDLRPDEGNYGGFVSIQRNFFEDVGLRLKGSYRHLAGSVPGGYFLEDGSPAPTAQIISTNVIGGNLDLLYYFDPCSPVSPYFGLGAGVASYDPDWEDVVNPQAESGTAAVLNLFFGAEWNIAENWNLITEAGLHSVTGSIDGVINNNRQGIFGSNADGYFTLYLGLHYYFSKGEPSRICDLYDGLKVDVPEMNYPTLAEIEEIARRNAAAPADIDYQRIEDIIKKYPCPGESMVLVGVNFEFDKSTLLPEAYPILEHAVEILNDNPDMRVEVQGHTDFIGTDSYNQGLSERRANTVRDYLVSKGIAANRLTTVGYGETKPVADNNTATGRAKNRRVEFLVK